ncbi:MAG: hypothetical protein AAFX92_10005 [Pseudomonadota bacterium]
MARVLVIAALLTAAACSRSGIEDFTVDLAGNMLSSYCEDISRCNRVCPDGTPTDDSRPICPTPAWIDP